MLLELNIKDLAIIDDLKVSLGPGLNVFTGETGAGKSIIIDAIDLVLGDRASSDSIRSGKDEARVEALFHTPGPGPMDSLLSASGIPSSGVLTIKRVIQRSGRNRVFINDCLSTLATLSDIGRRLIDVYGQSEHQSLTREEEHIEMLDEFGELGALRREMRDCFRKWSDLKRELDAVASDMKRSEEERELLLFQKKEIEDAALKDGDEEELKKERDKLKNAERLYAAANGAERALYSDGGSVLERLGALKKELADALRFDPSLDGAVKRLEAASFEIEDIAAFLRDYAGGIEGDPRRLEEAEARLDAIIKLKRKYGATVKEILERKGIIDGRLENITNCGERLKELTAGAERAREASALVSESLTQARKKAALRLKKGMEKELSELGMKGCVFEVLMDTDRKDGTPHFGEKGSDRVTFHISTNPGEETKPLSRVASGGELSRIMLAMKNLTSAGRVGTLVFDEIDSGVGATTGHAVAKKLSAVSKTHQVLCVTHLAQIATFAENHYFVEKAANEEGRTVTRVRKLDSKERVECTARLLGGADVTETTRKHARELLGRAGRGK
ncbi:MAG: DNA repair protein RecN [Deltaproteobacteria bacterium]|nr:DNA repair protein RecN [Deltaproteobacteria bacterium]